MYLDTSAIVKLYVREPDSLTIADAVAGHSLCTSILAMTELYSGLLSKERSGSISESVRTEAWVRWHQHVSLGAIQIVPIDNHLMHEAWQIMQLCHPRAPLRTLDAIHLASFASIDSAGPLLSTDVRMVAAALHLGLEVQELKRR